MLYQQALPKFRPFLHVDSLAIGDRQWRKLATMFENIDSLTGHNIAFCGLLNHILLGKSVNAESLVSLLNNFH